VTASIAALAVVVFTPLTQAASTVQFNPQGTGFGAGTTSTVFNVSSFSYDNGNALSVGGNQAFFNALAGTGSTTSQLYFQSTLGTVNGSTASGPALGVNNNVLSIGTNLNSLPTPNGASGDITINDSTGTQIANLSKQIVLVGTFAESVSGFNVGGGGNVSVQFADASAPVLSATNSVTLYVQPSGEANELAGTGFPGPGAVAIMTGHVIPSGFGSTFTSNFSEPASGTGSSSNPVTFDQYTYPNGGTSNYPGRQSISGTGATNFQVAVDSYNTSYFQNAPTIIGLSFNPVSTTAPFSQEPPAAVVQGHTPNFGTVNGGNLNPSFGPVNGGPDVMFQTQGTNNFSVPEPSSVSLAVTGIGLVSLARLWARRRRSKASAI
jgi:hypothetical protein